MPLAGVLAFVAACSVSSERHAPFRLFLLKRFLHRHSCSHALQGNSDDLVLLKKAISSSESLMSQSKFPILNYLKLNLSLSFKLCKSNVIKSSF